MIKLVFPIELNMFLGFDVFDYSGAFPVPLLESLCLPAQAMTPSGRRLLLESVAIGVVLGTCHSPAVIAVGICRQAMRRSQPNKQNKFFASPKAGNSNLAKFTSPRNTSILLAINRHFLIFGLTVPAINSKTWLVHPDFPAAMASWSSLPGIEFTQEGTASPGTILGPRPGSIQRSTWNRYGIDMNFLVV